MKFTTSEVEKILGIKRERFNAWLNKDYLYIRGNKKGQSATNYTITDLYRFSLFDILLAIGFSRSKAGLIVEQIEQIDDGWETIPPGYRQRIDIGFDVDLVVDLGSIKMRIDLKVDEMKG